MERDLLEALDTEWLQMCSRPGLRHATRQWARDDAVFGDFADLAAVVQAANRRGDPAASDRLLAALVRQARTDDLAARVLLQALVPGLKALVARLRYLGDRHEVASAVV